jgi:hypothetical protein
MPRSGSSRCVDKNADRCGCLNDFPEAVMMKQSVQVADADMV